METPGTTDVEDVSFMYNRNLRVYLIDTPGFDDTNRSDVEVLQDIAHWLSASFKDGIPLSGIIFLHRISDPRMAGSARRNLIIFKRPCGERAYQSVVLATSMWSKVSEAEGETRERELVETETFWGLVQEGQPGVPLPQHKAVGAGAGRVHPVAAHRGYARHSGRDCQQGPWD